MPQTTGSDNGEPIWSTIIPDIALQHRASELWRTTIAEMTSADTYAPINAFAVRRYVMFLVMWEQAAAETFRDGAIIESRATDDPRFNPWWKIVKECDTFASVHEDNLGLSPKRRAAVTPAKRRPKAQSKADAILGAKRA